MVSVLKVLQVAFRHEIFIAFVICLLCSLFSGISNVPTKLDVPADALEPGSAPVLNDNVYVWVQLSDVHVITNNTKAAKALYKVNSDVLPIVDPQLVVVTGDVVDSRGTWHPTQQKQVK